MAVTSQALWQTALGNLIKSQFARHVGVLTLANFIGAGLSFVQVILVARWLGAELYGVAALVMSYPALVYTFFDARSSEASVKYLSEFHVRGKREQALAMCKIGYGVDFVIAGLAFLVILTTAGWASNHIAHRPEAVSLIVIYSAAFLARALEGTSRAILATLGRFPVIGCLDTGSTLLRVGLVVGLVLAGWQVKGVIWGNAIAMLVTGMLYGAVAYRLVERTWGASWLQGKWYALKGKRREIFGFLAYNDVSVLLGMIPKQLDVVLLGYFRNPFEAGYYKLAKSFASAVGYLVRPLQSVTYPELSRLFSLGNIQRLRNKLRHMAVYIGVPLGLVVVLGTVLVPFVLSPLVGPTYIPATLATQLLLLGSAIWLTFFWLRPLYLARGDLKPWTIISVLVTCFSVVGFFVFIPSWGYLGLAIWLMVMHLFGNGLAALYLRGRIIG